MRCDQLCGLPPAAESFLAALRKEDTCPTCGHMTTDMKTEPCGTFDGMFGTEYHLVRYYLPDGRTADEFLQASPWSSGPCFFLGLRVSDGQEFLWPQAAIEDA